MPQSPSAQVSIRHYEGAVTVRFIDAVLASTSHALSVRDDSTREEQIFIPFDDIYFEFMERSVSAEACPVKGEANLWTVRAMGRSVPDAMRSYGQNEASGLLRDYGLFDPRKVNVEMTPANAPAT